MFREVLQLTFWSKWKTKPSKMEFSKEPVGDFYVYLLDRRQVSKEMTSSTKLLRNGTKPSVIHFYNGG